MCYIATIAPEEATGAVQALYQQQQGGLDYLPNYARVFCHRPQVMQAWADLQRAIRQEMDTRTYSLITLAAALAIRSSYCALAHGRKLLGRYFSEEQLLAIVRDEDPSPLAAGERAMMHFARKVALDSSSITARDIHALRDAGFSEARIFDIAAAAAARCFFAKLPDALGARPDAALGDLPPRLRDLLAVGRPAAKAPSV
ncbi:MAG: carboxymuconolactone decarboxylase family protein [Halioglobus sp.]